MFTRWVSWDSRDLAAFEEQVRAAKRLGIEGIFCSGLAEMTASQRDDLTCPYTLYTAPQSSVFKFVEAGVVRGVYEPSHIKKNSDLLRAKAEILAREGLKARFYMLEPQFLPESFYARHPALRGPRVDHPGRSKHPRYAPCIDRPEILDAYREGMRKLARLCPTLKQVHIFTNDCGAGICWCQNLYPGKNGPAGCKKASFAARMSKWLSALREGAREGGVKNLEIFFDPHGFTASEVKDTLKGLPEGAGFKIAAMLRWGMRQQFGYMPFKNGRLAVKVEASCDAGDFGPSRVPLPFAFLDTLSLLERSGFASVTTGGPVPGKGAPDIYIEIFRAIAKGVPETELEHLAFLGKVLAKIGVRRMKDKQLLAWREMDSAFRFWPRIWGMSYYNVHGHLLWDWRPIVAVPSRLKQSEKPYERDIFCAGTQKQREDLFWEAGYRLISNWKDATVFDHGLFNALGHAERAIEIMDKAARVAKGSEKAFIADQLDRARYMRAFFEMERNVIIAQSLIYKHTEQFEEQFRAQRALDYGRFRGAVEREIENTRELLKLAAKRPDFFAMAKPEGGRTAAASEIKRILTTRLKAMKRHLPDADDLFKGWRKFGKASDFAEGVMPVGW